ncbi:MAG: saccharopine dehydrogenase C-terminal domain-containing protein [Desulfobacterales bacterium]
MKIVVLGGMGMQGKAALVDLVNIDPVDDIICADADLKGWKQLEGFLDTSRIRPVQVDGSSPKAIASLLAQDVDVAIDLLPLPFMVNAFEAALEVGVPLVSTNYGKPIRRLHQAAAAAGVALMPECGLDPGIDLIICGHAVRQFDRLELIDSYCGGLPERKACDNPINYKISWNWDGVLRSQKRDSVFIENGCRLEVPAADQHTSRMIHQVEFPGLGALEAIPNGDAEFYTELLGVSATVRQAGRYSLRWPGWCAFWQPLKALGFLSDTPLTGLPCPVSPHQFLAELMPPYLRYRDDEKDIVAMLNRFEGLIDGRKKSIRTYLLIERDLQTGLFAMSAGVGFTAAIAARMIARKLITATGVLNPALDVPYEAFMSELSRRGIMVKEEVVVEGT